MLCVGIGSRVDRVAVVEVVPGIGSDSGQEVELALQVGILADAPVEVGLFDRDIIVSGVPDTVLEAPRSLSDGLLCRQMNGSEA